MAKEWLYAQVRDFNGNTGGAKILILYSYLRLEIMDYYTTRNFFTFISYKYVVTIIYFILNYEKCVDLLFNLLPRHYRHILQVKTKNR